MEYYNEEISKNPEVELIWYPREGEKDAQSWATKEKFPWPVIRERALEKVEPISKHFENAVPGYFLVDAHGELVTAGFSASKGYIDSLGDE